MEEIAFNQEEWNSKIREASKKWFEENSGLEVREIDLNNKFLVY